MDVLSRFLSWANAWPTHTKLLFGFAVTVVTIEVVFRRFAPRSPVYRRWTRLFEAIGHVWTSVILGIVYFLSVSLVAAGMKVFGKDPLDRSLETEASFWRPHEPNPLGPVAAARHQF